MDADQIKQRFSNLWAAAGSLADALPAGSPETIHQLAAVLRHELPKALFALSALPGTLNSGDVDIKTSNEVSAIETELGF